MDITHWPQPHKKKTLGHCEESITVTNGMPSSLGPKKETGDSFNGDKGNTIKGDIGPRGIKGDSGTIVKGQRVVLGHKAFPAFQVPMECPTVLAPRENRRQH